VYDHVLANLDTEVLYIINVTSINRIELEPNISDKLQDVLTPAALARYDFETVELNLFTQLVAIISFLRTHNKDFYIINNSKELSFSPYPPRDRFTEFLVQEPRAINVFKNSKFNFHKDVSGIKPYDYDQYGWHGHDVPEGHRAYYEFLKTLLPKFL
jgi:hypothetical protein